MSNPDASRFKTSSDPSSRRIRRRFGSFTRQTHPARVSNTTRSLDTPVPFRDIPPPPPSALSCPYPRTRHHPTSITTET